MIEPLKIEGASTVKSLVRIASQCLKKTCVLAHLNCLWSFLRKSDSVPRFSLANNAIRAL